MLARPIKSVKSPRTLTEQVYHPGRSTRVQPSMEGATDGSWLLGASSGPDQGRSAALPARIRSIYDDLPCSPCRRRRAQ